MTVDEANKAIGQGVAMRRYYTACLHLGVQRVPNAPMEFERWFLSEEGSHLVTSAMLSAIPGKVGGGND